ncbi:MAG: DUF3617 family protein [Pseudomonadota bacterium]
MRFASIILLCAALPSTAQDFTEGQWEFKSKLTVPGLSGIEGFQLPEGFELPEGMQMPVFGKDGVEVVNRNCITPASLVPPTNPEAQDCKVTEQQISGGLVRWRLQCATDQGQMVGVGEGQYSGTRMNATMQMQGTLHGLPISSNVVTAGRYLGACPGP